MSACNVTLSPPPSSNEKIGNTTYIGTYSGTSYAVSGGNSITVTETRDLLPLLSAGWQ